MLYLPGKSNTSRNIALALLLMDLVLFLLFLAFDVPKVRGLLTFLFLMVNLFAGYFLGLLLTLKYQLTDEFFEIHGLFGLKHIKVPLEEVKSWSRRITLIDTKGTALATPRFALGNGLDNDGNRAELFITSSKKAVYLCTDRGNFGISPELADEFTTHLNRLGVTQRLGPVKALTSAEEGKPRQVLNQLTLYSILLCAVLIAIPLFMHFVGLLPAWIRTSAHSFLPQQAYLEAVFTRGLLAVIFILFAYGVILLLSSIEGKIYYRLMYLPLAFIVVLLFLEITTQLNSQFLTLAGGLL